MFVIHQKRKLIQINKGGTLMEREEGELLVGEERETRKG